MQLLRAKTSSNRGSTRSSQASSEIESASESEPEPVSPGSAKSASVSGRHSHQRGTPRRTSYAQKLIHLSNTVRNLFASATLSASSAAGGLAFAAGAGGNGGGAQHVFSNSPAWILGRVYKLLGPLPPTPMGADMQSVANVSAASASNMVALLAAKRARFHADFNSKLWMTYRRGFSNIGNSSYTSDAGWGCMIRSAQMMLAQMFIRHYLGRDWRRPQRAGTQQQQQQQRSLSPDPSPHGARRSDDPAASAASSPSFSPSSAAASSPPPPSSLPPAAELPPLPAAYLRILSMFLDSPSASCPYSIHNLLLVGNGPTSPTAEGAKGKGASSPLSSFSPGSWFGPHNACWMLKSSMEAELAKLQARIAAGKAPPFGEDPLADSAFGGGEADYDPCASVCGSEGFQASCASNSCHAGTGEPIPPVFSVPKIYVSDDGTLYLDKLLKLACGEDFVLPPRPPTAASPSPDPVEAAASSAASVSLSPQPATPYSAAAAAPDATNSEPAVSASPATSAAATNATPHFSPSPSPLPSPAVTAAASVAAAAAAAGASTAAASFASPSSSSSSSWRLPSFSADFHPLLILIPLRLGMDKLNAAYIPSLLSLFQFPQCLGIIGGKPRSSLYFIGVQDEHLFYLDPHTVQRSWDLTGRDSLRNPSLSVRHAIADSYHCASVQSIHVTAIDPSLAIGFYIENMAVLEQFWEQAKQFSDPSTLQAAAVAAGLAPAPSPSAAASPSPSSASSSARSSQRGSPSPFASASRPNPAPRGLVLHSVFHVCETSPNYDFDGGGSSGSEGDDDEDYDDDDGDEEGDVEPEPEDVVDSARRAVDNRSESPVAVTTGSLPKDAQGRPLSQDSLTCSPVLCPRGTHATATTPTGLDLGSNAADGTAAHLQQPHQPSAVSSAAAATAATLSEFGHAASGWMAAVASTAQQQLAAAQQHLAHSAAQIQAAAAAAAASAAASASAQRSSSVGNASEATASELQQQRDIPLVSLAAARSPRDSAMHSGASSRSPAGAASSLSSPAAAASSAASASVLSPAASGKAVKSSASKARARAARRRTSAVEQRDAGSDGDDFVVI
jgi:hypothetical protein